MTLFIWAIYLFLGELASSLQDMIEFIKNEQFVKMPWKNGKGITSQIYIFPQNTSLAENNFLVRLSSAQIVENGEFSQFANKMRLLLTVKGTGFSLNNQTYERFEVAHFSGDEITFCSLLKEPVIDLGLIYDSQKVQIQARILKLKSDFEFSLENQSEYLITVLEGEVHCNDSKIEFLETIHFHNESTCRLSIKKNTTLFFCKMAFV